jgi:hypothetical protein
MISDADIPARELMNRRSLVYNVFRIQADVLPTENVAPFKETLAILLDARNNDGLIDTNLNVDRSGVRFSEEIKQMVQRWFFDDPQFTRMVVSELYSIFPFLPYDLLPLVMLPSPPPPSKRILLHR